MSEVVRIEKRKRGFFGKIIKFVFIAFNLLMLAWLVFGVNKAGSGIGNLATDAERAGAAIGTALGASMILMIWAIGDIILGIFVVLTRGQKIIIEKSK